MLSYMQLQDNQRYPKYYTLMPSLHFKTEFLITYLLSVIYSFL